MKIRAAIARRGTHRFSIDDCTLEAEPHRREVRLRLLACGICHTDLAARDQHLRTPLPAVLGHEGVGVIEAIGPEVSELHVGQRVLASFGACGECFSCMARAPAYCQHLARFCLQGRRLDGGSPLSQDGAPLTGHFFGQSSFATHAIVAAANLVPLDPDLPPALMAPLACGVQTGMSAMITILAPDVDSAVAVFGCGGVGLAAIMAARIQGCRHILAVDRLEERLVLARELGATATAHDIEAAVEPVAVWGGLSHALDTTGQPALIEHAFLHLLRSRGQLVCAGVGRPEATLNFNHNALMLSGRTLRGTIEGDADPRSFVPRMLDWFRQGRLPLHRLVKTYPFDSINEAVADMEAGRVIKPVLVFDPFEG
ncbi:MULTISPECIES: NAD(P)-dependent alcohol dehydrogenase [Burkholderia]|uniref:NAD(P)-dependent alcohol dehydrogenase n=1 Tax=Burkholderia TaxID=32008 RepID=UPI000841EB62|nr:MULTISPECIES: NAD(P)-dependent alcohol dehydrogenase [unclassified Burkholderia]